MESSLCQHARRPSPKPFGECGEKALAVSDAELNVTDSEGRSTGHGLSHGSSLSGASGACRKLGTAASWAVSFERLLDDPTGVLYFTDFLKSEVSAENILFWQACKKFQQIPASQKDKLTREARSIYDTYLSNNASYAINIDDKARVQERDLEFPTPDMFDRAQLQIFKLMKFDSYTRFVQSPLYRRCVLADVDGTPLPVLGHMVRSPEARHGEMADSPMPSDKRKKKAKLGRSLPPDAEDGAEKKKETAEKKGWERRREKRESWGAELVLDPRGLTRSSGRAEWTSLHSKSDTRPSSLYSQERAASGWVDKYCCVFLPDGTASLVATRPGISVRDMLQGLCHKRAIPLADVTIYLQREDTKHCVSLEQDSSLLKEQQVTLELQVTFTVEIAFTSKTCTIAVNGNKTLQEALSAILEQHSLSPQDAVVTMSGSRDPLNLTMAVFTLANKHLYLDKAKGKAQNSSPHVSAQSPTPQGKAEGAAEPIVGLPLPADRLRPKRRNPAARRAYDMDVLMDLLTRAQCCNVDDQRGLLSREHLALPSFLQIPLMECEEEGQKDRDTCQARSHPSLASSSLPSAEPEKHETRTDLPSSDLECSFIATDSARETIV